MKGRLRSDRLPFLFLSSFGTGNHVISTAFCFDCDRCYRILGARGDSIRQARNILIFAAPIRRANSVSLISAAFRSRSSRLMPGLSFAATPGSILSFLIGDN